jgi:hypothetical protein
MISGECIQLHEKWTWQRWPCLRAPKSSFQFLKLPTELRLDIFRHLLISEDPDGCATTRTLLTLRHTSNRLAREAEDVYWSENVFKFRRYHPDPGLGHYYFCKWLRNVPLDCVDKIRRISISSPTQATLYGPYHGHDYALATSTVAYNLNLTVIGNEQIVRVDYSPSHREVLRNYPYVASCCDLSGVARALFLRTGQICVTKQALVAFYLASSMPRSSAVFVDVLYEDEEVQRSRIIASLAFLSPPIDEYEDLW